MKKEIFTVLILLTLLAAAVFPAFGQDEDYVWFTQSTEQEEPETAVEAPERLIVGNTTKVSGKFFTSYFGSNTSDIDVRNAINGLSPTWWDNQIRFIADPNVTESLDKTTDPNGVTYTFTLFQDLVYNDGVTPITAADYVFSWLLSVSPELAEIGAVAPDFNIVGYEEYHDGETEIFAGIRLLSDYSFSMTIKDAFDPYFYELSQFQMYPYPISVIAPGCTVADDGEGAYINGPFTADLLRETVLDPETGYLSHPYLSAGPWKLTAYDAESGVVDFEINEFYKGNWEGQRPTIEKLRLVPVYPENMIEQLENGEVHLLNKCVDRKVIEAGLESGFAMENYPRLGYGFSAFSLDKKGPQQSQAVRQALAYAFDNDFFIEEMLGSFAIPVYGYYGVGQWMVSAANGVYRPNNMTEEQEAAWDALTLDGLNHYDLDLDKAKQLLIEDGWTLNADGGEFVEGTDDIRYKEVDGELMPLVLHFAQCERNDLAALMVAMYNQTLPQIGAALDAEIVPFTELLSDYYREDGQRRFDMNFMATNFVSVFDPYLHFSPDERLQGVVNNVAVADEELLQHAWEMRSTEPGNLYEFMVHWIDMQERFNEILPTMPLYSNIYFDFHTPWLQNYHPDMQYDWPVAMLYAAWGEPGESEEAESGEEDFESAGSITGADGFSIENFYVTEDFFNQVNEGQAGASTTETTESSAGESETITETETPANL